MRKSRLLVLLGCLSLTVSLGHSTAFASSASASDDYPNKTVKIVAPFAAGGIADLFARLIANHLSKEWNATVIVENRTGAGGNIGTTVVAQAAPDGYTLVMGNNGTHAINTSLFKEMPYDTANDFAPIVRVIEAEGMLVVHPSVPAHTVEDLLTIAKQDPGKLNYGSGGVGTTSHLAGALFQAKTNVDVTHVPYKGNLEAINSLVAGHTSMQFATMPTVLPFVKDGRLRAIAVIENQRSKAVPDVPTIAETVPDFDVKNWIGLFAPAGTPQHIIEKINREVNALMSTPEIQESHLAAAGARFTPNTPHEFSKYVNNEMEIWAKIIRDAGISIN